MRRIAGKIKQVYHGFSGFIIDIEGVLIKGETVIPGSPETIDTLNRLKKKLIYLSNISDQTREEVSRKLVKFGFVIDPNQIITSAYAATLFLKEAYSYVKNVFLIGTNSFRQELTANDFNIVDHHIDAQAVVVGLDFELNYLKMCEAAKAIKKGSLFVASNLAKIKLTGNSYIIGPGFTVKGLEYVTGKEAVLVGKPSQFMFKLALKKLNLEPYHVLTIGDKLEQDIYGGYSIGTRTCLVLSGAAGRSDIPGKNENYKPDFVLEEISHLLETTDKEER
ncbi:MAG: HAD-IIA family hydrolase [Candidatus Aminicenantes bacterium]|jgi:HAD superfamily hydrolase (TIGR01450 family)